MLANKSRSLCCVLLPDYKIFFNKENLQKQPSQLDYVEDLDRLLTSVESVRFGFIIRRYGLLVEIYKLFNTSWNGNFITLLEISGFLFRFCLFFFFLIVEDVGGDPQLCIPHAQIQRGHLFCL